MLEGYNKSDTHCDGCTTYSFYILSVVEAVAGFALAFILLTDMKDIINLYVPFDKSFNPILVFVCSMYLIFLVITYFAARGPFFCIIIHFVINIFMIMAFLTLIGTYFGYLTSKKEIAKFQEMKFFIPIGAFFIAAMINFVFSCCILFGAHSDDKGNTKPQKEKEEEKEDPVAPESVQTEQQ